MMKKFIGYFDFLSIKPELNFSSEDRVKTTLGGFLSIFLYLATIFGLIFFSQDFFNKKGPIVSESSIYSDNVLNYITKENFYVKFGLFNWDSTSLGKDWESYYNVFAYQFSYLYQFNNSTQKNEVKLFTRQIPTTKCTKAYMDKFYPEFNTTSYDYFHCLDPEFNVTLMNRFANVGENAYLNFYFTLCKNETAALNGKVCKPIEEIKQKIYTHIVKFSFGDYFIDNEDYLSPFKPFLNDQHLGGDLSKYNRKNVFLKDYNYTTDVGAVLEE